MAARGAGDRTTQIGALAIVFPNPSGQIAQLLDGCSTVWRMGFGAIIDLLGGKAIQ